MCWAVQWLFLKSAQSSLDLQLNIAFYFNFLAFSQIFCDFGEAFTVVDTNGEQPISNMISSVTKVHNMT